MILILISEKYFEKFKYPVNFAPTFILGSLLLLSILHKIVRTCHWTSFKMNSIGRMNKYFIYLYQFYLLATLFFYFILIQKA